MVLLEHTQNFFRSKSVGQPGEGAKEARASERGGGGTMTPGPIDFRGSIGFKGPVKGPTGLCRAHRNRRSKTFF